MLTFMIVANKRIVRTATLAGFANKYRSHFRPGASLQEFMDGAARRAGEMGIYLDPSSPERFVLSLIEAKMVTIVTPGELQ